MSLIYYNDYNVYSSKIFIFNMEKAGYCYCTWEQIGSNSVLCIVETVSRKSVSSYQTHFRNMFRLILTLLQSLSVISAFPTAENEETKEVIILLYF